MEELRGSLAEALVASGAARPSARRAARAERAIFICVGPGLEGRPNLLMVERAEGGGKRRKAFARRRAVDAVGRKQDRVRGQCDFCVAKEGERLAGSGEGDAADGQGGENEANAGLHGCPLSCAGVQLPVPRWSACRRGLRPPGGANWGETGISHGILES